jgi:predicted MFS family arabinose efflux permease
VGYGLMVAAFGSGAMAGAWIMPRINSRLSSHQIRAAAAFALGLSMAGLAVIRIIPLLALTVILGGAAWITAVSNFNVAVLRLVEPRMRARTMAFYLMASYGGTSAGILLWGILAKKTSLAEALMSAAVLMVLLGFAHLVLNAGSPDKNPGGASESPDPPTKERDEVTG